MENFRIYVYRNKDKVREILEVPYGRKVDMLDINMRFPIVTNALFQAARRQGDVDQLHDFVDKGVWKERIEKVLVDFSDILSARQDILNPIMKEGKDRVTVLFNETQRYRANSLKHFEEALDLSLFLQSEDPTPDFISFQFELYMINNALRWWLAPYGKGRVGTKSRPSPSQRFAADFYNVDPFHLDGYFYEMLSCYSDSVPESILPGHYLMQIFRHERNLQFSTELTSIETSTKKYDRGGAKLIKEANSLSFLYTSQHGLLPLVWAEILYCVANDIFIQKCDVCKNFFAIPRLEGKPHQKYCGIVCRREADKQRKHSE